MLADGEIAQYPMLTFALATIADELPRRGQGHRLLRPARHDAAKNGATIWMPAGDLHPEDDQEQLDAAKDFLAFIASVDGRRRA